MRNPPSQNPQTGKIPVNIRMLEVQFTEQQASKIAKASRMDNGDKVSNWISRDPDNVGRRTRAIAIRCFQREYFISLVERLVE